MNVLPTILASLLLATLIRTVGLGVLFSKLDSNDRHPGWGKVFFGSAAGTIAAAAAGGLAGLLAIAGVPPAVTLPLGFFAGSLVLVVVIARIVGRPMGQTFAALLITEIALFGVGLLAVAHPALPWIVGFGAWAVDGLQQRSLARARRQLAI